MIEKVFVFLSVTYKFIDVFDYISKMRDIENAVLIKFVII